jgi:hypothetical protein
MRVVLNTARTEAKLEMTEGRIMTLTCENEGGVLPLVAMWLMPLVAPEECTWEQYVRSEESTSLVSLEEFKEAV